jgi:nucleoside-diphosphate-sugar epimerase
MKKNLLITGASGFIGSYLVELALKKEYNTVAAVRPTSNKHWLKDPSIHFLELDFKNDQSLDHAIREFIKRFGHIDYVIHNAGVTRANKNEEYDQVNCDNTIRLVHALQRNNEVPDKFVLISSLAAYGPAKNEAPVKTSDFKAPLTAYGRSKHKAEEFLYSLSDFPFVIINPTAVYGPKDKDVFFLINSIQKGFEVYIGNKQQMLSFVHAEDLAAAIFLAMESEEVRKNFLVSDQKVYTSNAFNQQIKTILQKKTLSIVMPVLVVRIVAIFAEMAGSVTGKVPILNRERLKEFEAPNWAVDSSEIDQLGYQPKYNLEAGLHDAIKWYKEQGWLS